MEVATMEMLQTILVVVLLAIGIPYHCDPEPRQ